MSQALQRTGLFFAIAFFAAGVLNTLAFVYQHVGSVSRYLTDPTMLPLFLIGGIFLLSAFISKLGFLQPVLFLLMVPLGFGDNLESFYGLGFFAVAVLILRQMNFFNHRRTLKLSILLGYLYVVELYFALKSSHFTKSLYPVFFMTIFLLFLFIMFREQIVIYLKEPKARLSLRERGLSAAERSYVLELSKGKTLKEVAFDYEVSESTVRNTLARAYKKLGVEDKTELVALAAKCDLVD